MLRLCCHILDCGDAVAAGDGVLKDGKHRHLAADAKAWHLHHGSLCGVLHCLACEYWVSDAHVRKRLGGSGGALREGRARTQRSALDAAA